MTHQNRVYARIPWAKMWNWLKDRAVFTFSVLREAGVAFGQDRANRMSAAVAYRMIFALAPLMLIALWVFGLILGDSTGAEQEMLDRIESIAGTQVAGAVSILIASAIETGDAAAVVGFVLLLWTSSSLFLELQNDLNDIFEVPYDHITGVAAFIRQRGLGFLWTLGLGVLLITVWAVNFLWGFFESLFDRSGLRLFHDVIGQLSPFVSLVVLPVLFALVFQSLTRVRVRRRALFFGSAFTSVMFVISAFGIGLYFNWDENTSASQFAGALFVILLATFVLSAVFLYGAEVTNVYHRYIETGEIEAEEPPGPEVVVAQPEPAMPLAAVLGFLGGLFVGWRRRS